MTTIFIGPYLVIPPRRVVSNKRERVCSNHCATPLIAKPSSFCANCGGAVLDLDVPVEEVKPLSIMDLDRKWEDFMFCPYYGQNHPKGDMWLPNRGQHGMSFERGSEDAFIPVQLANIDGAGMLDKAQRAYEKFVDALKKDFDIEPFWEVGVVAYSS